MFLRSIVSISGLVICADQQEELDTSELHLVLCVRLAHFVGESLVKTQSFMMCDVDCVPVSWSWLRIPGVLQRLGFTYFVLSLLQTFWGRREIAATAVSRTVRFTLICHRTVEGGKTSKWLRERGTIALNKTFG